MGRWSFLPAVIGFWLGILFLLLLDHVIPHLHRNANQAEGPKSRATRTTMMVLAVTLHNIPEGMAVGVVYAGLRSGAAEITAGGAMALALGIPSRTSPRALLSPCPSTQRGRPSGGPFWTAHSPAPWSRSAPC